MLALGWIFECFAGFKEIESVRKYQRDAYHPQPIQKQSNMRCKHAPTVVPNQNVHNLICLFVLNLNGFIRVAFVGNAFCAHCVIERVRVICGTKICTARKLGQILFRWNEVSPKRNGIVHRQIFIYFWAQWRLSNGFSLLR